MRVEYQKCGDAEKMMKARLSSKQAIMSRYVRIMGVENTIIHITKQGEQWITDLHYLCFDRVLELEQARIAPSQRRTPT